MRVLIIGAAGMLGKKLSHRLARDGLLDNKPIDQLILYDVVTAIQPGETQVPVEIKSGDLSATGEAEDLIATRPDVVFHLAAIVSGQAEQEFDKGYRVNLDGTRIFLEAVRHADYQPRVIFASSIGIFGAPFPEAIPDDYFVTPLTSYGTQKAICELLISDYTRKGFLDGFSLRLPTICVRPGKPNAAASGFFSNIIREPLIGEEAILPVPEDVLHWHASPRAAIGFFLHAVKIDADLVGPRRAITMPGVSVTVSEQIESLRSIAGDKAVARIHREPDPFIREIVNAWLRKFEARRAIDLGFVPDIDFAEIIRIHIEDELGGSIS